MLPRYRFGEVWHIKGGDITVMTLGVSQPGLHQDALLRIDFSFTYARNQVVGTSMDLSTVKGWERLDEEDDEVR